MALTASRSPETVAGDTRRCTVAGAGAVEAAAYVRNRPHRGPRVMNAAGSLR